jgi:two-component system, OmpR family, sensor histidine kinase VicK
VAEKDKERTEIWDGIENISIKSWEVLSRAKQRSDYCHDSKSASFLVANERYFQMIKQLWARGIKQRFVTEVTAENIRSCKELDKYVELRHLDGVKGNFGIVDGREYGASANIYALQPPIEFIYSNVKTFVEQQQYFFETLWNRAIPAEKKIRQIEQGIPAEVTEIWYGSENIIKKSWEIISRAKVSSDYCHNSKSPSIFVTNWYYLRAIMKLSKRGVRHRFVTEITNENIEHCKKLAKYVELRHLDGVKGNFAIIDGKEYGATANLSEFRPPTEFIHSNVKEFVDQQQYFFETLWNRAIPIEQRIREIEEGIPIETTEIIDGSENILNRAIEGLSFTKERFDNCIDRTCPSSYVLTRQMWDKCIELSNKDVKLRFITEITSENISYCKEIMKIAKLRHLDGIRGNFGISDGRDYRATATMQKGQPPSQAIRSTIKTFVDQQQFFFETLWNKAIPAEKKIIEIEQGIPAEVTEIWYGADNIVNRQLQIITKAKSTVDYCHSSESPSVITTFKPFIHTITRLNKRGVKQRYITEITEGNIRSCRELAKYVELRHLDRVQGTLGIIDGKIYGAIANTKENHLPTEFIYSNVKTFVDQQQYFFETLWNKAMPAEQRIIQLEEGIIPESIETLSDPFKIQELAHQLVRSAKKEVLVVFASQNEFLRQQHIRNGFLTPIYSRTKKSTAITRSTSKENKLDVRITVPTAPKNNIDKPFKQERPAGAQHLSPTVRLEIRHIDVGLSTEVSVLVVDRKHSLVIELKDHTSKESSFDNEENEEERTQKPKGLAIYTNSKGLVVSTVSMFELLWTHIDLYEELKLRDIAQREFINIAAHELRGPIQPILGLSEVIRTHKHLSSEGELLSVILNSAARLQRLANSVLDVARIENKSLKLEITAFNMTDLIRSVMENFKNELRNKHGLRVQFNPSHRQLLVYADRDRVYQVVYNLVANAVKFTDHGLISISANRIHHNAVRVSIRDSGQGIDEEILPKLFSKFATSSMASGTGLGLFISQKIVEAHGGRLYGVNNNGNKLNGVGSQGATFTFILPVRGLGVSGSLS